MSYREDYYKYAGSYENANESGLDSNWNGFDFSEKTGKRKLVIVSDMLQNSERLSFYKSCNSSSIDAKCPSFQKFMENLSDKDYLMATAPKGKGVDLEMIYLNNRYETKKELDISLVKLWENYFKEQKNDSKKRLFSRFEC